MADGRIYRLKDKQTNEVIDLIDGTFKLIYMDAGMPAVKDGGIIQSSPFHEGSYPLIKTLDNVIDTLTLVGVGDDQDIIINRLQQLFRFLDRAVNRWRKDYTDFAVWIEARGFSETGLRKAFLVDWSVTGLPDPFSAPWDQGYANSQTGEFNLILSHTLWQNGDEDEVLNISGRGNGQEVVNNYQVNASTNDIRVYQGVGASASTGATTISCGKPVNNQWAEFGVRFVNVTIPTDGVLTSATLVLQYAAEDIIPRPGNVYEGHMHGHDIDNSGAFSTLADYQGRARTAAYTKFEPPDINLYGAYFQSDVFDAVNEVVTRPGWVSGNSITLLLDGSHADFPTDEKLFAAWDHATLDAPKLILRWSVPAGTEFTTEDICFVSNKDTMAGITHIFRYDASLAAYTANLALSSDFDLLPMPTGVGDIVYFGNQASGNFGPFDNIIFDFLWTNGIGTAMVGVWEFYDVGAAAWVGWSAANLPVDNTLGFLNTGVQAFSFPPYDLNGVNLWGPVIVNAVNALWIRFRVTVAAGIASTPHQYNRKVYTCTWPHVLVNGSDLIKGDLPAVTQWNLAIESNEEGNAFPLVSTNGMPYGKANRMMASHRSNYRYDFSRTIYREFLHFSDRQMPVSQTCTIVIGGGVGTFVDDIMSSTGRPFRWNPAIVTLKTPLVDLVVNDGNNYIGAYRALLRCRQDGGVIGDFRLWLEIRAQSYYWTSTMEQTKSLRAGVNPFWNILDMGFVTLPDNSRFNVGSFQATFTVQGENINGGAPGDLFLDDLILIPADEWIGEYFDLTTSPVFFMNRQSWGRKLRLGSTIPLKTINHSEIINTSGDIAKAGHVGNWTTNAITSPILDYHQDQTCAFVSAVRYLGGWVCNPFGLHRVNGYRSDRYYWARGRE